MVEGDGLENVQETNDLFNKMKFLEFVIFFYSWVGVACSMVAYELRYNDSIDGVISDRIGLQVFILLGINSLCSVCATCSIVSRYIITLDWQHKRRLVLPLDNLYTSGQYKLMIIELLITILAPNPGI